VQFFPSTYKRKTQSVGSSDIYICRAILVLLICASSAVASPKQIYKNVVPVNRPTTPRQPGIRRN